MDIMFYIPKRKSGRPLIWVFSICRVDKQDFALIVLASNGMLCSFQVVLRISKNSILVCHLKHKNFRQCECLKKLLY